MTNSSEPKRSRSFPISISIMMMSAWADLLTTGSYPFMHIAYPLIGCLLYIIVLIAFWPSDTKETMRAPRSRLVNYIVCAHNAFLMLFSLAICWGTMPDFYRTAIKAGSWSRFATGAYRDAHWRFFGPFAWAFYISKYYEFVDTLIILYKGGRPSTLQVFHHIGAVLTMWCAVVTSNPCSWVFVTFNAATHSAMYLYYALTAVGYRPNWKILITSLQIFQFFLGLFVSYGYFAVKGGLNPAQTMAVSITQTYASIVLFMFCQFAYTTYFAKAAKSKAHEA